MARLNRDPITVVKGDDVLKYLLLSNGHDGLVSVKVGFTPQRVVCMNTLRAAHQHSASRLLRVKHTQRVNETLLEVRDVINVVDREFEATAEQYRLLSKHQVNAKDLDRYVRVVFGLPEKAEGSEEKQKGDRVVSKIIPLFEKGRGNDMPGVRGTLWAAYNSVTEFLTHGRGRSEETRIDSLWFGQGALINQRALETAVELAKAA